MHAADCCPPPSKRLTLTCQQKHGAREQPRKWPCLLQSWLHPDSCCTAPNSSQRLHPVYATATCTQSLPSLRQNAQPAAAATRLPVTSLPGTHCAPKARSKTTRADERFSPSAGGGRCAAAAGSRRAQAAAASAQRPPLRPARKTRPSSRDPRAAAGTCARARRGAGQRRCGARGFARRRPWPAPEQRCARRRVAPIHDGMQPRVPA